ncbi:MAG: hypothetical protein J7J22_04605 [Candidatus Verstraetearchaeota archaeon]|nr:hypothetical protein [Candidatus Verstraetearchaeota archaeon]
MSERAWVRILMKSNPWMSVGDKVISVNVNRNGNITLRVGDERVTISRKVAREFFARALAFTVIVTTASKSVDFEKLWTMYRKSRKGKKTARKKSEEEEEEEEIEIEEGERE